MNYRIAIPSYKRYDILLKKTLKMLQENNISANLIDIFVGDEEEKQKYFEILPKNFYDKLIIGRKGVPDFRLAIRDYYDENTKILCIDDDIEEVHVLKNNKLEVVTDLEKYIIQAFKECEYNNCHLWGVYPVDNDFYMNDKISTNLKFIFGGFFGLINIHDKETYVTLNEKDDYERSIKFFIKDNAVIRLNFLSLKTKCYVSPGGMEYFRTKEKVQKAVDSLVSRYPFYVFKNDKRKSGYAEILLKDKKFKIGTLRSYFE